VIDAYLGAHHDSDLTFEEEEKILAAAEAELDVLASEREGGHVTQEGERNE
jgi:hypothetical protein